jgi:hypothetical protein
MRRDIPEPDPRSELEDEGIPDLQDGRPERDWAQDPQQEPIPGEQATALDEWGTTAEEQAAGEPLDTRLSREVADDAANAGTTPDLDIPRDRDITAPDAAADEDEPVAPAGEGPPAEEEVRPAGRLVAPDEGTRTDTEKDEVAMEVGPDAGGYTAEEAAVRVEPE